MGSGFYDLYFRAYHKAEHYHAKYKQFEQSDRRYEFYKQKYLKHRKKARFYYSRLSEVVSFSELQSYLKSIGIEESSVLMESNYSSPS